MWFIQEAMASDGGAGRVGGSECPLGVLIFGEWEPLEAFNMGK